MANYSTLKSEVASVVKTNGQNEITGENMQQTLNKIIDSVGGYWLFGGIARPGNNPGTNIDQNVAWLALQPGTYTNFGRQVLPNGKVGVLYWNDNQWNIFYDDTPTGSIYNVNIAQNQAPGASYYTSKASARNLIPSTVYKQGLIIVYWLVGTGWNIEICVNSTFSQRTQDTSWEQLYPSSLSISDCVFNVGIQPDETYAYAAVPSAKRNNGTIVVFYNILNSSYEMKMFAPSSPLPLPISSTDWGDNGNWTEIFFHQPSQ